MFSKLEKAEKKYDDLNNQICEINISNQPDLYKSIMKEIKQLFPIIEKYREYKKKVLWY